MIVFEELTPGSLVSESMLMDKTGLGRTPVREALQRLSRSRMVEIHPNKGVHIPATSVEAELRMLELRRVLEALAVRLACRNARQEERADMSAMLERLLGGGFTLREYAETVKGTHELIVRGARNEYVADAMAPVQGLSRRFWFNHVVDEESEIKVGSTRHIAILRAILDRDADAAEEASYELNDYLVDFSYATLKRNAGR